MKLYSVEVKRECGGYVDVKLECLTSELNKNLKYEFEDQLFSILGINNDTNTKPFDLEKALKGHKVITRDKQEVTQLKLFDVSTTHFPLVGVVDGRLCYWECSGKSSKYDQLDIFLAKETKHGWLVKRGTNIITTYPNNEEYKTAEQIKEVYRLYDKAMGIIESVSVYPISWEE